MGRGWEATKDTPGGSGRQWLGGKLWELWRRIREVPHLHGSYIQPIFMVAR